MKPIPKAALLMVAFLKAAFLKKFLLKGTLLKEPVSVVILTAGLLFGCSPGPSQTPPASDSGVLSTPIGYEGLRMCRPLVHHLWGEFLMTGEVLSIESARDMRVNVLHVRDIRNPAIELAGYPREAIDRRADWYPCSG